MSDLAAFYLGTRRKVKKYECFKISHPNFTQDYFIVMNKVGGLTATIDGSPQAFQYYPFRKSDQSQRANLDYGMQIDMGDLGNIIPQELAAVDAADGWGTKPTLTYWAFSSEDLTTPLLGPITLEIPSFPMTREGTSFIAQAPDMTVNRTGELFLASRFPGLRAFQ